MTTKSLRDLLTTPDFNPTGEQLAIRMEALAGRDLVVKAYAGTGKTAVAVDTAQFIKRRGRMIMFNASARKDAAARMPPYIKVSTGHSLAHDHIIKTSVLFQRKLQYTMDCRGQSIPAKLICDQFNVDARPDLACTAAQIASASLGTLTAFLISAAHEPQPLHVPHKAIPLSLRLADDLAKQEELKELLASLATNIWGRMKHERDRFPISHDGYLKLLQLRELELSEEDEVWLLDEYQDTNPVFNSIIQSQVGQKIFIGDPRQQIFSWRGAINAMESKIDAGTKVMPLSESFRFNHQIAGIANILLQSMGETVPLKGQSYNLSQLDLRRHHTVIVRNNMTLFKVAAEYRDYRQSVYIPGGMNPETRIKAESALALRQGRLADVRVAALKELGSWQAFEDAARTIGDEFPEYRDLVELTNTYGNDINAIIGHCSRPWDAIKNDQGRVTITTGHKSKGREWGYTRLASDLALAPSVVQKLIDKAALTEQERETVNLLYVAITRCKKGIVLPARIKQNLNDLNNSPNKDITDFSTNNSKKKDTLTPDEVKKRTAKFIKNNKKA